jgi:hypothetical protein
MTMAENVPGQGGNLDGVDAEDHLPATGDGGCWPGESTASSCGTALAGSEKRLGTVLRDSDYGSSCSP